MARRGMAPPPIEAGVLAYRWVIPAEHLKDFRTCLRIVLENAAEELSMICCFEAPRQEAATEDFDQLCRAAGLLDQVGWSDPEVEEQIEIVVPPDDFAWACRSARRIVTPPEARETVLFIEWLQTMPFDVDVELEAEAG